MSSGPTLDPQPAMANAIETPGTADGSTVKSVLGVVEIEKNCQANPQSPCLKVTGGEDLNDKQTFWITSENTQFEILKAEDGAQDTKVRIWSEDKQSSVVMRGKTPVHLLGNLEKTPTGDTTLTRIHSVALLEK